MCVGGGGGWGVAGVGRYVLIYINLCSRIDTFRSASEGPFSS